jgi:hypothetical protein
MQAVSSSGDYDAPAEVGVIDVDALADLPPLDEALVPEAMGILGFDMADLSGGATEAPETFAVDAIDTRAKKPKIPGGNQREVQKRYRERKKNYTKDLERKVESLETQLKELIGAKQRADEDDVLTLVASGRVVRHDHHPGGYDDDSAYSTVDASCGPGGNGAVGECPLEHRRVAEAFHAKIANMRALLDAGASDAQLSGALQDTLKFCAPTRAMGTGTGPGNISYQLILNKHAAALNAEAKGAGPVRRTTREPGSSAEPERDASSNVAGACAAGACVGSVCGGPLRTVALDGTMMSEDDVASAISAACDSFLTHTPPIEVQKLIDWYDEYMRDLRAVYFERQKLGLQLAAAGGAIVASTAAIASNTIASNTSGEEKSASGSDDSKAPSLFPSVAASDAVATVTLVAGGAPGTAPSRYGVGANVGLDAPFANASSAGAEREESGPRQTVGRTVSAQTPGAKTPDALAVVELLRESVRREMRMKCEKTAELITRTLSPRTAAHLASAMLPALPDPLAIAAEAKARGFRGTKRWSAVEA